MISISINNGIRGCLEWPPDHHITKLPIGYGIGAEDGWDCLFYGITGGHIL